MGEVEYRTLKQLVQHGKQAEGIVAKVRNEAGESRARPEMPLKQAPE